MKLTDKQIRAFQTTVWKFYETGRREFPWRPPSLELQKDGTADPYAVLVSEVMLQQTQAERVVPFFTRFMRAFPTVEALAEAPLMNVLRAWQGLGYNRRALHLKRAAEILVQKYGGRIPRDAEALDSLPGVGTYTAQAVLAFSYNLPVACIETNIRAVYLHFFFPRKKNVRDEEILELVEQTLPAFPRHSNVLQNVGKSGVALRRKDDLHILPVREWYAALMDYGAMLKKEAGNPNARSAHFSKQSVFRGSRRELRARLLWRVLKNGAVRAEELKRETFAFPPRGILEELAAEGFLRKDGGAFVPV